jgi:hypothetical protein
LKRQKPGFFNPGLSAFFRVKIARQPLPEFDVLKGNHLASFLLNTPETSWAR